MTSEASGNYHEMQGPCFPEGGAGVIFSALSRTQLPNAWGPSCTVSVLGVVLAPLQSFSGMFAATTLGSVLELCLVYAQ